MILCLSITLLSLLKVRVFVVASSFCVFDPAAKRISKVILFEIKKDNVDGQEIESDFDEMESDVDDMESIVNEEEDPLISWLFEMENIVHEQEIRKMESYADEQLDSNIVLVEQDTSISSAVKDTSISSAEKDTLISLFLEVGVGQSIQTTKQYLQATNWDLEDAIRQFFSVEVRYPNTSYELINLGEANVRAETVPSDVSAVDNSLDDNLASMYPPHLELMYKGPFHKAKKPVEDEDKWLIVNVQSKQEFSFLRLNLDTWAHEAVSQTIIDIFPAALILDPITGKNVKPWSGMAEAVVGGFNTLHGCRSKHHLTRLCRKRPTETSQQTTVLKTTEEEDEDVFLAILASMENTTHIVDPSCSDTDEPVTSSRKKLTYPDFPEEPKVDKKLLCRIGVRLPEGYPVQLLWSFCKSHLDEAESRPFHLIQAIPGASETLNYESKKTFEESGLANSMISVTWD
ncbi:hypothetical protein MKW98_008371 [Papaver atlanticum]|uniref:UBX domain-containing protein n=1 Tax=Papaver atlanticum TaxID=357466 RepID=A0AAD4XDD8_9MAGN|nr:hypothetical protein MKW98_008371 [Papaver atlanticum]